MTQAYRLPRGGAIDREQPLTFRFNGRPYQGYAGDTLASALLANGVRLVARSFRHHRPRGIVAVGVEEPNALVQLGSGARSVPNLKATEIELFDGLSATSVNVFPSVRYDAGALIGNLSRCMPAGFYYKTFFGSQRLWTALFEPLIRHAAGWGRAPESADPDFYDRMHAHCEVLVVGGGAAGIVAASAAAASGVRVILADENEFLGAGLLHRTTRFDGLTGAAWAQAAVADLRVKNNVRLLRRTSVSGYFDDNYLVALERRGHEGQTSSPARTRQRLWHIRAEQVVLATGAHERPLVFANNDRPGIMLASAAQAYVNRYAVRPGLRTAFFVNNDRAYECVLDLLNQDCAVAAVVDSRPAQTGALVTAVRDRGVPVHAAHAVCNTRGTRALTSVTIAPFRQDGRINAAASARIDCDVLAVSGGYSPVVHLHSQAQGSLAYDAPQSCFRPDRARQACISVGACNATFGLAEALQEARAAGLAAAKLCGKPTAIAPPLPQVDEIPTPPPVPLWRVPLHRAGNEHRQYVDLQNDTSVADIGLAVREGFESVEHMKRYTLTGFGTDQGKLSNINALAILAETVGRPIGETGTTTFRPPYTPVTFGAMGGRDRGNLFEPARVTDMHAQHTAAGVVFEDVSQWKRPWYYPRAGEDMHAAVARECKAVREHVGMFDASTLGKIDIQGPDALEFLNRVYTNRWDTLAVGRIRYGLMCREDGMLFDDGTTARIDECRYLMTTTTGGAAAVLDHLEEYLQTEWPDLRVRLTSVTEQWSTVAIAGPRSRAVLATLAPGLDWSADAFPFLHWRKAEVAGIDARVCRISFSGELQYEINVPWRCGSTLWDNVCEAGTPHNIVPYGTEAMHVLRAEKGYIITGQETDGTQTPHDLGLGWLLKDSGDYIGRRSFSRPDMQRDDRLQLVGLRPASGHPLIPEGTQLVETGSARRPPPVAMLGHITSSYWSVSLRAPIALALVKGGRARIGDVIAAALPGAEVPVTVCNPVFYDPDNRRRNG